ncbi:MAG: hypothetical protein HY866_09925 [Chloroflexi bacterium]|nr:hypothetical protein [Chloroflexota bacterium]
MRLYRRSRLRSSRGHVRVEQGSPWGVWAVWAGAVVVIALIIILLIQQIAGSVLKDDKKPSGNRTWLEFAWASTPLNEEAIQQLADRLKDNGIEVVYLEAAAWRTDGTLLEGEFAAQFASSIKEAYPGIKVLLWLRMSGPEIGEPERRAAVSVLAGKSVQEWGFAGVQLNGRAVANNSESFIELVRSLRSAIGSESMLSVTVPPDRIPNDPAVPIGSTAEPGLTWDVNYKQRVVLLSIDEIVIMAHAAGLMTTADYETWVAYQVDTYAQVMAELDRPAGIVVALPTYDAAPDHDPEVESIRSAVRGTNAGIKRAGKNGDLVKGVGLYEYKTTDSLEWAWFREDWLGVKPK